MIKGACEKPQRLTKKPKVADGNKNKGDRISLKSITKITIH